MLKVYVKPEINFQEMKVFENIATSGSCWSGLASDKTTSYIIFKSANISINLDTYVDNCSGSWTTATYDYIYNILTSNPYNIVIDKDVMIADIEKASKQAAEPTVYFDYDDSFSS